MGARRDENGARIASLDEMSYREQLWDHRPITDFWRIGHGYAKRLASAGMYTMGDVARCSVRSEDLLYKMFGVNAELLIDHAWGYEPCTIADIKNYRPTDRSLSSGQVLSRPYKFEEARIIVREMTDMLSLDLVSKGVLTDQIVLTVCYDTENISRRTDSSFKGKTKKDRYGRTAPMDARGSVNIPGGYTSSGRAMLDAVTGLYDSIVDRDLLVRRIYVVVNHIKSERRVEKESSEQQLDIFSLTGQDGPDEEKQRADRSERARQEAVLAIRSRYGKNAIVRGMDLQESATAMERNAQVGGHKA